MRLIFLLSLQLFSFELLGKTIEAPYLSPNLDQNPSHIHWKKIDTDHFEIIFPKEIESKAQRVAHLVEKAYPYVTRSLEVKPPKIPLVLHNQNLDSNGFVALAPRRSEWFITPSTDPELSNTEWLKTLAIHELRHVVQFQKTKTGFNKVLAIFLGEIGEALGVGLTLPPWFLEGDAVGIETALSRGGRGRLPLFERDLRTLLLSGKKWNYDKAHLGSYEDYVPNHYVYGYFYTSWLRNNYGDLFLSTLTESSSENSWNPLSFYHATEELTGESFESFYKNVISHLILEWRKRSDEFTPTPYKTYHAEERFGWTNYSYPQVTPDKKILVLKQGLSFIDQFVLIDGKNEKRLFYPGKIQNHYPYKLRGGKLPFFEVDVDPRWGMRNYSSLKVFDYEKNKVFLLKSKLKGRLAVPDHQGKRILYVEWDEAQKQSLVLLNRTGREEKRIEYPSQQVITSIDWLNQDEVVFVQRDESDLKSIVKMNLHTKEVTTLLDKRITNVGNIFCEDGRVFYEGSDSGIDNIFLLTDSHPRQVTSSRFGAYAPTLHGKKLLYNDYSVEGMNVVEKKIPWDQEEKSGDSFYPIYEKFSKTEKFQDFESDLKTQDKYSVREYSQLKNSLNLHSWVILAPPLTSTVTLMGLSRDILNKLNLTAGGEYNLNEGTLMGFTSLSWTHFYPVMDLMASYGNRRQDVLVANKKVHNKWEEGTLEGGFGIPWRSIQERFNHNFSARAFSRLIKVTNKISSSESEVSDGVLFSPGVEISYSLLQRFSRRDMNPQWGLSLDGTLEEGKDVTGSGQRGSLQSLDGRVYLPGVWYHHSFYHQIAFEKQSDHSYQYASLISYPRGVGSVFLEEFTKYSGNYLMPVFYPDKNFSKYLYLKRISLNLFYDELKSTLPRPYQMSSAGWEGLFEMNLLRIFVPFTVGLRGSYVLSGEEKGENNYELFLSSVMGTF